MFLDHLGQRVIDFTVFSAVGTRLCVYGAQGVFFAFCGCRMVGVA
jgi:hypothetical protein